MMNIIGHREYNTVIRTEAQEFIEENAEELRNLGELEALDYIEEHFTELYNYLREYRENTEAGTYVKILNNTNSADIAEHYTNERIAAPLDALRVQALIALMLDIYEEVERRAKVGGLIPY